MIAKMITLPERVVGLSDGTLAVVNELFELWASKYPRNVERKIYVDGKNLLKNKNIAVPPQLEDEDVVIGWPEKAVYSVADRIMFDGVVSSDGNEDPFDLKKLLDDNRFDVEFPQGVTSALTYSTAFVSQSLGDVSKGEPHVRIMFHSALWATALWDKAKRAVSAGLLINSVDDLGRPTKFTFVDGREWITCVKGNEWYVDSVVPHGLPRVPFEPLPYRPDLDRPFGRSRVNRKVRSLTDRAMRASLRLDVHSELFQAPHLLLLGAGAEAFLDNDGNPIPLWSWYMSMVNAVGRDEEGEVPTLETVSQQSPQPHIDTLRSLAALFSGETNVPLSSLGIVQDNPASAEAIAASREDLVIDASRAAKVMGNYLKRVFENAVMLRDGLSEVPDELRSINIKWRNAAMPSVVSQSDAMVKQIAAVPDLALSDVALEEMGYSREQIVRIRADIKRAGAGSILDRVLAERSQPVAAVNVDDAG